ncbi:hypothetical protein ACWEOE_29010, partial [Amycolatopsis sp. NPDC004368]
PAHIIRLVGGYPAAPLLLLLNQEAARTGDDRYRITGATLRSWVHRGHITRGPGGYSPREVLAYLESREHSRG